MAQEERNIKLSDALQERFVEIADEDARVTLEKQRVQNKAQALWLDVKEEYELTEFGNLTYDKDKGEVTVHPVPEQQQGMTPPDLTQLMKEKGQEE